MKSDTELVQLLKAGDEKAFEIVYNQFFEGLCLFAESITKNHDAAEEIVEELFVQIWINCKVNPIETSIKSYLYQSTYNNSIKYISRIHKNLVRIESLDYTLTDNKVYELLTPDYPVVNLIARELEEKAVKIIEALPKQCKDIYLLNRDENLKYNEIAERLHITVGTVKAQMSRAFSKLRTELKEFLYSFL